ncbi:Vms1/Ankzf1 family peptidyl-tRNA hydrolase [Methanolobus mangrovi]|uniref:Vms1/Ankzf1 family peptidyl-tRNA hydrolase n=1 Tax=Methanolobus mangrovi TaxID=3072977 RepID=A0AA51UDE8_9EURY|nr:Vms1/Ankzf1 family peptidyl-tRNA hydrolase [Methanolobus mangrovi]WMW21096.1 Vms1/Ankzf1 family peptidyl-tRNA hydrolase [Methanolobus mangrovi]
MVEKEKVINNINYIFKKYSGKEELENEINRLRSHILELELDVKTANVRYEKGAASEKKAIAAKQEAEENLKAAEVKLCTLEHELDKQKVEASGDLSFTHVDLFNKQRTEEFLLCISSVKYLTESLLTVCIAAGGRLDGIRDYENLLRLIDSETLALIEKVDSSTGFVLFHSPDHMVNELIIPPLPLKSSYWGTGNNFDITPVIELLNKDASICVLVAHAGESFVGLSLDREEFDSFQVIKSSVKAKHAKGGFSQRRFERLRDEDIAHHIDKVKFSLKDMLEEFEGTIDYLILAGDPQLAREIATDIPLDIEQVLSSSDIHIEKNNISDILNQILISRRYRF